MANSNSRTRIGLGAGGTAQRTLIYETDVAPAVERISPIPGRVRGTVDTALDITAFQLANGSITIGSVTVAVDTSALPDIASISMGINDAIQNNAALVGYIFSLDYVQFKFYGRIINNNGDVPALSGNLAVAFGLDSPVVISTHTPQNPPVVLQAPSSGKWNEIVFSVLGNSFGSNSYSFECFFFDTGTKLVSKYLVFNNVNGWEQGTVVQNIGPIEIGLCIAWNVSYVSVLYDPVTREITWMPVAGVGIPVSDMWQPSIQSLLVVGS